MASASFASIPFTQSTFPDADGPGVGLGVSPMGDAVAVTVTVATGVLLAGVPVKGRCVGVTVGVTVGVGVVDASVVAGTTVDVGLGDFVGDDDGLFVELGEGDDVGGGDPQLTWGLLFMPSGIPSLSPSSEYEMIVPIPG
jgi:hypothetical protein